MTLEKLECPRCGGSGEYHPPLQPPDHADICSLCGGSGEVWPFQLDREG